MWKQIEVGNGPTGGDVWCEGEKWEVTQII